MTACVCKQSSQNTDHLPWECELSKETSLEIRVSIMKVGGKWPITNFDLANTYTIFFSKSL
jgi:hypothetical protein